MTLVDLFLIVVFFIIARAAFTALSWIWNYDYKDDIVMVLLNVVVSASVFAFLLSILRFIIYCWTNNIQII